MKELLESRMVLEKFEKVKDDGSLLYKVIETEILFDKKDLMKTVKLEKLLPTKFEKMDDYLAAGYIYHLLGQTDKALYHLFNCSDHYFSKYIFGEIYEEKGEAKTALELYEQSSMQGYSFGLFKQGYVTENLLKDMDKAIDLYLRAVEKGNVFAAYQLGKHYQDECIEHLMLEHFTFAADSGHSESQYITGKIYYEGEHTEKDLELAFEYFWRSSKSNHPKSQYLTGKCYENGY